MSLICETIISEDELSQTHSRDDNQLETSASDRCGGTDGGADDEEELDYEEDNEAHRASGGETGVGGDEDDKDEGELDDDEDLEEGEVKEDEDDECADATTQFNRKRVMAPDAERTNTNNSNSNNATNSVCRFFGRGQCTWGNACRFVHPTGGMNLLKRGGGGLPPLPPLPPMPPMGPIGLPPHPPNRGAHNRGVQREHFYEANTGSAANNAGNESAWERGLKQAKEMIVRASRRKEEEIDFEDKRFNLGVEDDHVVRPGGGAGGLRDSRDSSHSPMEDRMYDNDEYERRRRLAFESAPWNNEEPPKMMRSAETYRDPWRRSKSPPPSAVKAFRGGTGRPLAGSRSGSKRSHSMSSISASGSDSSDFSGSEGSSFSESSASNMSAERSGGRSNRRFNRKVMEKKKEPLLPQQPMDSSQRFPKKVPLNTNWTKSNANEVRDDAREYDSWSESLSDSESMSSYYSASNTDSDDVSNGNQNKQRQTTTALNNNRVDAKRVNSGCATVKKDSVMKSSAQKRKLPIVGSAIDQPLSGSGDGMAKKTKMAADERRKSGGGGGRRSVSPLLNKMATKEPTMTSMASPKKSPIKMTFMKKHSTLKKDNSVAVKLNGGRDNEDLNMEDMEEDIVSSPAIQLSPSGSPSELRNKSSASSVSPVSDTRCGPSSPPLQCQPIAMATTTTTSSSSSGSASSAKHDKQSLSATVSRREELLQQLRAVEDAIARKRSKIN